MFLKVQTALKLWILYKCSHCGKLVKGLHQYESYVKLHKEVKTNTCTNCDKEFRKKANRDPHEKIFSRVKQYVCNHCGKAF